VPLVLFSGERTGIGAARAMCCAARRRARKTGARVFMVKEAELRRGGW